MEQEMADLNRHLQDFPGICYRSKLFLGYSVFKLVYFFQTRSVCLNLGQFVSK